MACDLETTFGPLAARVPTGAVGDAHFILSARSLPVPPESLDTDRLVVRRSWHDYGYNGTYRVDALWVQASRETCRHLGLLILAVLFHEQPSEVRLNLRHPASDVKQVVVEYEYRSDDYPGYQSRPYAFCYSPDETHRHPWYLTPGGARPEDLPCFLLTTPDYPYNEASWATRDLVRVSGSDRALVQLAELLLDAGRPDNPVLEYDLEGEGGFRGVGIHSAEMRLLLPGSFGWDGIL